MTRAEYLVRCREFVKRGEDLPQTKIADADVEAIKSAFRQREELRAYIRENLSNEALAARYGVHRRTIEKIACGATRYTI